MDHSEHFSREELACRCCGKCEMTPELLILAEKIRVILGNRRMKVTSAYRCVSHNSDPNVGGKPDSKHLTGRAMDFRPLDGMSVHKAHKIILAAYKRGELPELGGLGHYRSFLHVDTYHVLRRW